MVLVVPMFEMEDEGTYFNTAAVIDAFDDRDREALKTASEKLEDLLHRFNREGKRALLVVDEAQYVREIGLNLKLLIDHLPDLRIVATGSSSAAGSSVAAGSSARASSRKSAVSPMIRVATGPS